MSEKDGKFRAGIPRPDLREALLYFSGGVRHINDALTPWCRIRKYLEATPYCGFEFVFYVVHYHGLNSFQYALLGMPNLVCSESVWAAFLAFKKVARDRCRVAMDVHLDVISTSTLGRTMAEVLMDPLSEAGPVARVEMAIRRAAAGDFDPEPVLAKYGPRAGELLTGMPEFLPYAPTIRNAMEADAHVTGYLFSKCGGPAG